MTEQSYTFCPPNFASSFYEERLRDSHIEITVCQNKKVGVESIFEAFILQIIENCDDKDHLKNSLLLTHIWSKSYHFTFIIMSFLRVVPNFKLSQCSYHFICYRAWYDLSLEWKKQNRNGLFFSWDSDLIKSQDLDQRNKVHEVTSVIILDGLRTAMQARIFRVQICTTREEENRESLKVQMIYEFIENPRLEITIFQFFPCRAPSTMLFWIFWK